MRDTEFTDSHIHLWDLGEPTLRYSWLDANAVDETMGNYDAIKSLRYYPEDFEAESRFSNVTRVIHVQAATDIEDPVEETRWLQALADDTGIPHGIVAYADLSAPRVADILARHCAFANVRGIRDLRYDDYLTNDAWRRGYAQLESFGLVCCDDPLLEAMADAAELARTFPGITYCVDHAGFPRRRDPDYFDEWRRGMRVLAGPDNTIVKISGLGMADHRWTVESLRPWVLECIDAWGVERSFFGTNWPVDRLYSSYGDLVDAYREIVSDFTADEQFALLAGNANRVFRI